MLHPNRVERVRRVTGAAVVIARDVARVLPHGGNAVVTTEASAAGLRVIHPDNGSEVVERVAQLALGLGRNMVRGPRSRADSRTDRVTSNANTRRPLEDALLVTVLAREIPMSAYQLESGGEVIKLGALDCRSVRYEDEHRDERKQPCTRRPGTGPCPALFVSAHWALIRPRTLEARSVVTLLAPGAEAPCMHVITGVACSAEHRRLYDVLRSDVAISAAYLCVCTQ